MLNNWEFTGKEAGVNRQRNFYAANILKLIPLYAQDKNNQEEIS